MQINYEIVQQLRLAKRGDLADKLVREHLDKLREVKHELLKIEWRLAWRREAERKKELGLCIYGGCKNPFKKGRFMCEEHLRKR